MHVVMFDIDGTLVDSADFDTALYVEAVRSILNVEIDSDWSSYEHDGDSGILEQVLRDARLDGKPDDLAARVRHPVSYTDLREIDAILAHLGVS